jgi:hypothetical protein
MPKDVNNPESFKTRRGKVGGYRDQFTADELVTIERCVSDNLSSAFGYTDEH